MYTIEFFFLLFTFSTSADDEISARFANFSRRLSVTIHALLLLLYALACSVLRDKSKFTFVFHNNNWFLLSRKLTRVEALRCSDNTYYHLIVFQRDDTDI